MIIIYQPSKLKKIINHGFIKRMSTQDGIIVLKRRRQKSRKILTVTL